MNGNKELTRRSFVGSIASTAAVVGLGRCDLFAKNTSLINNAKDAFFCVSHMLSSPMPHIDAAEVTVVDETISILLTLTL
jgi:hypothetical protein